MRTLTTWGLLLLAMAPRFARSAAIEPVNIVLVMCDDLGWGDVGFNGNDIIQTPHLDAMAANGMKFTRFYAASAVCSPTRGSVVTGRHPYRYGIDGANKGHMLPQELTLAELMKEQGYVTGHFGKWHLGTLTKTVKDSNRGGPQNANHFSPPWINGFDVCFSTEAKVPTYDPMFKPAAKSSGNGWDYIPDLSMAVPYGTHYWNQSGEMVTDHLEGDDSRVIMDRAVPFIQEAAGQSRPFFMIIWFHTPHLPVVAGPEHAQRYANHDSHTRNYYGCITAMDEQVGRLRKTLRDFGVDQHTLVTFCSDNGPEGAKGKAPGSAGPFRGRKRDLFEGGIRVPGIVEWPGRIRPGSVTDYPACTSDYLPTIVEIFGMDMPDARPLDGLSLLPVFKDPAIERAAPIGFQFDGKTALIDNRYKLVTYPVGENKGNKKRRRKQTSAEPMLFDLIADPGEINDIVADHAEIVSQMSSRLKEWLASCQESREKTGEVP